MKSKKRVGSTAASKVLHLICSDLFIMWDSEIRKKYNKRKGNGEDYFEFLKEMRNLYKEFEDIIKDLQQKSKNIYNRTL
jgi:hypothetical protein